MAGFFESLEAAMGSGVSLDVLKVWCHGMGLPLPEREVRFAAPDRQWRFDYAWPALKVAWEYEGGTWSRGRHVRAAGYANDCEKYSEAAIRGWCVMRVTADMVKDGRAFNLLERALRSRLQQPGGVA